MKTTRKPAAPRPPAPVHRPPSTEPDTVLLAVTGMSPAILTETLWALAHEPEPILPTRVIVLTTLAGRAEIERTLFQPHPRFGQPPWDALRAALAARGHDLTGRLRFGTTPDDLRVFTTATPATGRSRELEDIRTRDDNAAAADFLLQHVRSLVENPDLRLIASLAGGRKTMGALLYACLTLVGRDTDRLTHVLVNDPFDTLRDFYFPGQPGGPIPDRQGRPCDPARATVDLADVPFIPLRNLLAQNLGHPAGNFMRLVAQCQHTLRQRVGERLTLEIAQNRPRLHINGVQLKTAPREHLLLLFLATRAKAAQPPYLAYKDALNDLNQFRANLRANAPADLCDWRHHDALKTDLDDRDITRLLSDLKRKIQALGGEPAGLALCLPEKGRFNLELTPSLIHLK